MGLKKVTPEVLVNENRGVKLSMPHPDPCWVIRNLEKTGTMADGNGSLVVFSDEEKANAYMTKDGPEDNYVLEEYCWDDLVDKFSSGYSEVIVDHKGESDFYLSVPLQKGI
jgi:hypothetical protein